MPLFDGQSLEGWYAVPHIDPRVVAEMEEAERREKLDAWMAEARQHWSVEQGEQGPELVNDGEGPYLATEKSYGDFELTLDYKIEAHTDSGVYLRGSPQVQIWNPDDPSKQGHGGDKGSGGLWNNSPGRPGKDPLVRADRPIGEWNTLRIVMVGQYVTVWLNDQLVVDHAPMENYFDRSQPIFKEGPIILQTHGGETRWRNIRLREIPPEEANALLRRGGPAKEQGAQGEQGDDGFVAIFNGKDLTGWKGATSANPVEDGVLISHNGVIYTEKEYGDFTVRLEFLLPPEGNNGLAIRYPGHGDPAFAGMCEIQLLDNSYFIDKVRPESLHGSAYGLVGARPGFLRPTGEWNYQTVTVKGSTIKVELNGYPILDCDLSKVEDPRHPLTSFKGLDRTQGHFGLAGHHSAVRFRNIDLKPLD